MSDDDALREAKRYFESELGFEMDDDVARFIRDSIQEGETVSDALLRCFRERGLEIQEGETAYDVLSRFRNKRNEPPNNDVDPHHACPHCNERSAGQLVWLSDDRVQCQRCNTIYNPGGDNLPKESQN